MISLIISFLLLSSTLAKTDIYVGYPNKGKDFSTIQDAVNEAATINPQNESERVTIHIAPGLYRQQVRIETSYITIKNEEPQLGDVKVTWYYGIGYKYYSANELGYYDKDLAESKTSKNPAKFRWGATVLLLPSAYYFRAENIYFENSFNNYITEEELKDGVELTFETGIREIRNISLDVCSRSATERAAAFSSEGPYAEFYGCEFHSSQDTLFTSNSPQYFKNCVIEGMTDYIFGESNAVFESCELRWKGYSDQVLGGVITAARKKENDEGIYSGYFFYNCRVTASEKFKSSSGGFGRPWRQTAKVIFVNTILEDENKINNEGWGAMACEPEKADLFLEYGTRFANGTLVDTSKRRGKLMESFDYIKFDIKEYMNNWIPFYSNSKNMEDYYEWGSLKIGGGGFISGLVVGKKEMYIRTDVGGAYKYDYKNKKWVQLFGFIKEANKGYMSVKGIAIDPNDDNVVYFLCGCAYHYPYRSAILKTTDGGLSFSETDISDLIEVHGNGAGRECGEPIAIDPQNPYIIYAGGDVASGESALIKSMDAGLTWKPVKGYDDLGFFKYEVKWPSWTDHITRGTENGRYDSQSGINSIKIIDRKVYVGTSIIGQPNIHVAEVEKDIFEVLSEELPNNNFPLSIKYDGNENMYFSYIKDVKFDGKDGGVYKYNILTKKVTNISPTNKAVVITIDKNDPNKLIARTVACWLQQFWSEERSEESTVYGDHFYRSTDGGQYWINITPGQIGNKGKEDQYYISLPLKENGYSWIINKSIHWGSSLEFDPREPNKLLTTSGNGLFVCDNIWDEKNIQFYFNPEGIEETVPMDMISVKNGNLFSAIRDFDGFIHQEVDDFGIQYKPNMGNTAVIAYCKKNPKIMLRIHINEDLGYYSEDGGETWKKMESVGGEGSGRGAITEIGDEKYRFFHATKNGIMYSDNYGKTWENSKGPIGEELGIFVEDSDPMIVYTYSHIKETDIYPKPQNILGVSGNGGKTFYNKVVSDHDNNSEFSNRIAYLGEGKIVVCAGNKGIYLISNFGEKVNKIETVDYCKTIGYGAPELKGYNTLYMYGRPLNSDPEGLYRSQDCGITWVLVNHNQLYGGTGDGNFVVGDMNEFGKFYMSSLGYGIVYGKLKEIIK